MMNKEKCKEQLQQDIISYLDGMDNEVVDHVCDLVVKNINQIEEGDSQSELNDKLDQVVLGIHRGTEALNLIGRIIRNK